MRSSQLEPSDHILLQQKGFQAKHKIADQWENTTYEIIEKLADVPIYKIHKFPKPGEDSDESHPLQTKVVHQNMLFLLDWTDTDISEDRDNGNRLSNHQACILQGDAADKMDPVKMLVYNLWGMAVRM